MKRLLRGFFFPFLLISTGLFGQQETKINRSLQDFASQIKMQGNANGKNGKVAEEDVTGSPYLNEEFVQGEIITCDSVKYSGIPVRYNAGKEEIEVKMPDGRIYDLAKNGNQVSEVIIHGTILVLTRYEAGGKVQSGFLRLLYRGRSQLFLRQYKYIKEGVPSNGIVPAIPPAYTDKPDEFYIKVKLSNPRLCRSKKELLGILEDHSQEVATFLKKEKVNTNHGDDLIKVLTYYDSL